MNPHRHVESIAPDIARALVKVGGGRGFLLGDLIVTAAHCLARPPTTIARPEERMYPIGPLGSGKPSALVLVECIFYDPIADIAVLEESEHDVECAFETLVNSLKHLKAAEAVPPIVDPLPYPVIGSEGPATVETSLERYSKPQLGWLIGLSGRPIMCEITPCPRGALFIGKAAEPIEGGMSGSPILNAEGAAVGVLVCSAGRAITGLTFEGGPNPELLDVLPRWLINRVLVKPAA
jgi:hypothetical protein